jgi:PadR family transcriptional regulator
LFYIAKSDFYIPREDGATPMSPRPLGYATLAVLQAIADGHRYGFDVIAHTGLPSGTVYPALATLTRKGLAKARWEDDSVARSDRRPRRKYYAVTPAGEVDLRESMARFRGMGLRPAGDSMPGAAS